jgi:hypothetical protein
LIDIQKSTPGLLSVWAWAQSQVLSYAISQRLVNPNSIGILGHSRRGKTALLASALDSRWAFVIAHQSGTFGAASPTRMVLESPESITRNFPHWFTPSLSRVKSNELNFDQSELIGLISPRAVLISEGHRDLWASPFNSATTFNLAKERYFRSRPARIEYLIENYEHEINQRFTERFADFINRQIR